MRRFSPDSERRSCPRSWHVSRRTGIPPVREDRRPAWQGRRASSLSGKTGVPPVREDGLPACQGRQASRLSGKTGVQPVREDGRPACQGRQASRLSGKTGFQPVREDRRPACQGRRASSLSFHRRTGGTPVFLSRMNGAAGLHRRPRISRRKHNPGESHFFRMWKWQKASQPATPI